MGYQYLQFVVLSGRFVNKGITITIIPLLCIFILMTFWFLIPTNIESVTDVKYQNKKSDGNIININIRDSI